MFPELFLAYPFDGKAEAFTWFCIVAEKRNSRIYHLKKFFLVMDNGYYFFAFMDAVAEKAAEREDITLVVFPRIDRTGFGAAAAVIAVIAV